MWQRFTERARRVILLGQEEASRMDSEHVGTEHMLLGLMRENEGAAARILEKMGVTLSKVRQEIDAQVPPGGDPSTAEPKLTSQAKRVLELSADESRCMGHNYIGTEHMLLALLRERDGLAAAVLGKLGLSLEKTRAQVVEYLVPDVPDLPAPEAIAPSVPSPGTGTAAAEPPPPWWFRKLFPRWSK